MSARWRGERQLNTTCRVVLPGTGEWSENRAGDDGGQSDRADGERMIQRG